MKTLSKSIRLFLCLKTPEKELPIDTSEVKVNRRKGLIWINSKRIYYEWHFDVFELIPEGLAIDINTLDASG